MCYKCKMYTSYNKNNLIVYNFYNNYVSKWQYFGSIGLNTMRYHNSFHPLTLLTVVCKICDIVYMTHIL